MAKNIFWASQTSLSTSWWTCTRYLNHKFISNNKPIYRVSITLFKQETKMIRRTKSIFSVGLKKINHLILTQPTCIFKINRFCRNASIYEEEYWDQRWPVQEIVFCELVPISSKILWCCCIPFPCWYTCCRVITIWFIIIRNQPIKHNCIMPTVLHCILSIRYFQSNKKELALRGVHLITSLGEHFYCQKTSK